MLRRAGSSAGVGVPAEISRCWTCCVQIGYKGRFTFFGPATEPRNHAVSFRPFQSGKALCHRFGHRVRRRGRFGHRARPLPDAQPRPNLGQTPNVSLTGGGSASRPHPVLCGRGHSARPGAARTGRGHSTPPGTEIRSPAARDAPGWKERSPAAQDVAVGGQAQARGVRLSSGLRAARFRLGRAARPGQLAHADFPRRVAGPAPGRCSPHAWPQHRRRPPVVRRSARSTAPEP